MLGRIAMQTCAEVYERKTVITHDNRPGQPILCEVMLIINASSGEITAPAGFPTRSRIRACVSYQSVQEAPTGRHPASWGSGLV